MMRPALPAERPGFVLPQLRAVAKSLLFAVKIAVSGYVRVSVRQTTNSHASMVEDGLPITLRNSRRVSGLVRNSPSIDDVTMLTPGL